MPRWRTAGDEQLQGEAADPDRNLPRGVRGRARNLIAGELNFLLRRPLSLGVGNPRNGNPGCVAWRAGRFMALADLSPVALSLVPPEGRPARWRGAQPVELAAGARALVQV